MNGVRQLRFWLRSLFHGQRLDAEMEEEMGFHIEKDIAANMDGGMDRDEARFVALRTFGGIESIKEDCREDRGVSWIENAVKDVGYAIRMLGKSPGFTTVVVLTLTLGIGVNLALFALLNDQLLRPRPVLRPEELWAICPADSSGRKCGVRFCRPYYEAVRNNKGAFNGIIGYARIFPKLRTADGWEPVVAQLASGDYFNFLGVQPVIGRGFVPEEDDKPGAHRVVVISYRFWHRYFHGERAILGRTLTLNDQVLEVIGVAPRGFNGFGAPLSEFWLPTSLENALDEISNYTLLGRLSNGVSPVEAAGSLTAEVREVTKSMSLGVIPGYQRYAYARGFTQVMIEREGYGSLGPEFDLDFIIKEFRLGALATVLVLLIAAMNLASLLLARALGRRKELATRLALGATRWVLVRQLMLEGVLVAVLGSVCGVLLLRWLGHSLPALISVVVYRETPLLPDFRVVAFAIVSALLVGAGFSVLPALEATRFDPFAALRDPQGCLSLSGRRSSLRSALVVTQVAGSLVLFSGACLGVRAINGELRHDVGFRTDPLAMIMVDLRKVGNRTNAAPPMVEQLRRRLSLLPGVEAVGMTDTRPFSFQGGQLRVPRLDGYASPNSTPIMFDYAFVGPETFRALGISVSQGREVASADFLDHRRVALVNESFVKRYWSGQIPLGKQINQYEIIGVLGDARLSSPVEPPSPAVYFAGDPNTIQQFTFIIRSKNNPKSLISAIRAEVMKVHPRLGESRVLTMRQAMLDVLILERSVLKVIGALAAVGLVLTMLGAYGVTSYLVVQRRREIGLRLAVGAQRSDVAKLIFRFGLGLAGAGVAFGLPAAAVGAWVLRHLVSDVSPFDITAYFIASVVLLLAVGLACWLPARRATKIDPMTTLRLE